MPFSRHMGNKWEKSDCIQPIQWLIVKDAHMREVCYTRRPANFFDRSSRFKYVVDLNFRHNKSSAFGRSTPPVQESSEAQVNVSMMMDGFANCFRLKVN